MTAARDVIIGGGVIGLSLAYELATRGRRVLLIEREGKPGQKTSWAGAGILPPAGYARPLDPLERLRALSHRMIPQWSEQLRAETGIDNGFQRCGGIYLATTRAEAAALAAQAMDWRDQEIECERLDDAALLRFAPDLRGAVEQGTLRGAWYAPDECQIRNPRHCQALAEACRRRGVQFCFDEEVVAIAKRDGQTQHVTTARGTRIEGTQFCLCGGAWNDRLLGGLGIDAGLLPVRGQMIRYQTESQIAGPILNEGNRYLVSRDAQTAIAGSNEEEVGFQAGVTPDVIESIRQWAESLFPSLKRQSVVQTWSGFRPGSFDGWPYLGRVPSHTNLFVAAGHYRSGLHLACGTARVIADLMCGKAPGVDISPFRLGR